MATKTAPKIRKAPVKRFVKQPCENCGKDVQFDLWLAIKCPTCEAKPGSHCKDLRSRNGGIRLRPHPERSA